MTTGPPRPTGATTGLGVPERVALAGLSVALLVGSTWAVFSLPLHFDLVAAAGVVLAAVFFVLPRSSVLLLVALQVSVGMLWWVPGTVGGLGLLELFGGVSSLAVLVLALPAMRRIEQSDLFVPVMLLGGLLVVAAFRAPTPVTGVGVLVRYAGPLVLALVVASLFREAWVQRLAWLTLALAIVPPALVSTWLLATGQMAEVSLAGLNRLVGGFQDVSAHGQVMAVGTALVLGAAPMVPGRWRTAAWALAAVTAACMFLSQSRTAQIGLVGFGAVWLVASGRRRAALAMAVVLVLAVATSSVLQDRFDDLVAWTTVDPLDGPQAIEDLGSGRVRIWKYSLESFARQSPLDQLFGVGLGDHRSLYLDTRTSGKATHNDWLALAFQAGPLASLLYAWALARVARAAWSLRAIAAPSTWERAAADAGLGLVAMVVVMNFFSNAFVSRVNTAWMFWAAAGLVVAIHARARAEVAASHITRAARRPARSDGHP